MSGTIDRRHFMQHAAAGAAIATTGAAFLTDVRLQAETMAKKGKSLVFVHLGGGPPTIDMWDMKPGSANGGEHKPAKTAASGIEINERFKKIGEQFKNLSLIRSMSSGEGDHDRGRFVMNTGHQPSPLVDFPHIGSVLSYLAGKDTERMKNMDLPMFMSVGGGGSPGFLGMRHAAFTINNAGSPPENVEPYAGSNMQRRSELFKLLEGVTPDKLGMKTNVPADAAKAHKDTYMKALDLVVSSRKDVFKFNDKETKELERYGTGGFGRACLLARKLVDTGVACIKLELGGWDLHGQVFNALDTKLPELDNGFGSLVADLTASGKIKDTVLCIVGDFGRTPKINMTNGRDHWPLCWSVLLGGGNIKGGVAFGSTNADGTGIQDNKVTPIELFSTLYRGLGIDPTPANNAEVRDNLGRPYNIGGDNPPHIKELV